MDFNQVRYFLALADTLNFTRAAERCHVSQPGLTQSIKRLEEELGGDLVYREGRYTELTELGKSLRGHFEQIDQTRRMLRTTAKEAISNEITELNIGLMCTIGPRVLTSMLDTFQMQHPMVSIVLHDVAPASIPDLLLSGTLDGVFCARHGSRHSQLRYVSLFEEEMVIAFPQGHAFASMDSVPLREISKQRYVERLHCEFRHEILDLFDEEELTIDVVFRSQREDWIQSMVRDGIGICCIPRYSLLRPELDHRPICDPLLLRKVELAVADKAKITPTLKMFIEQVSNHAWPTNESI